MKLNTSALFSRAPHLTTMKVSPSMQLTVLGEVVDAVTGAPIEVSADALRNMDVWQAANFLHDRFAGDSAFVIQTPHAFALVRPPFSELPVFYLMRKDCVDVWSGLEVPAILQYSRPEFDLDYLSIAMHNWSWMTPRTGFRGVWELLSGAVLIFDGRNLVQRDLLAAAVLKLPRGRAVSYDEQVSSMRALILNSVRHKLGPHLDHASILCSGGVDSSVGAVAAMSLYPDRKLPLIHGYSEEHLRGDERFYFEAMAARTGWPAATVDMNEGSSRTSLSPELLVPTVRPMKSAAALSTMATLKGLAKAHGGRVMLSGDGGDQLFLLNDPMMYCREMLREVTTPAASLRAVSELASMGRKSMWQVVGEALRGARAGRLHERFFGNLRFQPNPLARKPVPKDVQVVPNGDMLSGLGISRAFQYFGMRNAELNQVPLNGYAVEERKTFVFWPLIREAMIAKRRHHLHGGRDRAIERDAFRDELPAEVYHRHSKGAGRDFAERYDLEFLIKSLQNSSVVQHGLVGEQIRDIVASKVSDDMVFALVVARGFADWMELYV